MVLDAVGGDECERLVGTQFLQLVSVEHCGRWGGTWREYCNCVDPRLLGGGLGSGRIVASHSVGVMLVLLLLVPGLLF